MNNPVKTAILLSGTAATAKEAADHGLSSPEPAAAVAITVVLLTGKKMFDVVGEHVSNTKRE